jgi:hypothetical protein
LGSASRPDQASFPRGETYQVAGRASVARAIRQRLAATKNTMRWMAWFLMACEFLEEGDLAAGGLRARFPY